jgi:hypothetical protein
MQLAQCSVADDDSRSLRCVMAVLVTANPVVLSSAARRGLAGTWSLGKRRTGRAMTVGDTSTTVQLF